MATITHSEEKDLLDAVCERLATLLARTVPPKEVTELAREFWYGVEDSAHGFTMYGAELLMDRTVETYKEACDVD